MWKRMINLRIYSTNTAYVPLMRNYLNILTKLILHVLPSQPCIPCQGIYAKKIFFGEGLNGDKKYFQWHTSKYQLYGSIYAILHFCKASMQKNLAVLLINHNVTCRVLHILSVMIWSTSSNNMLCPNHQPKCLSPVFFIKVPNPYIFNHNTYHIQMWDYWNITDFPPFKPWRSCRTQAEPYT